MTGPSLPPHLLAALQGRGVARADVQVYVAQLEAHGIEIEVRRLQLGDMRAAGFGEWKVIHRTQHKEPK